MVVVLALGAANVVADTHLTLTGNADHAEICRFRAGDKEKPFDRWLAAKDVTCVVAEETTTFPSGLWNVFAKSRGGVSADPILVDGTRPPKDLVIALLPSATIILQLPAEQTAVLYSPRHVTAFPAAERTSVPAGEELWLFVMEKSMPVAVIPIASIDAGTKRTVDARNRSSAPAVVGWLRVSEEDRNAIQHARGVQMPRIRITAAGKDSDALSLPGPDVLNGAFFLISKATTGDAELRLDGRGWLPARRPVRISKESLTLLREPVAARASTTVMVNWSTSGDLPALERSIGSCEPQKEAPVLELAIASCQEPKPGKRLDPATCTVMRKETLRQDLTFGTVTIDEVPPGLYRAELRYGRLPPVDVVSQVPPLQSWPIQLQAKYVEIYGSLTRGGAPLGEDARIEFPSGGLGFAPRASSDYGGVLKEGFGTDARIDVITCKGKRAFVLADHGYAPHTRFDIDIPDNLLTVSVADTFTSATLPAAMLHYVVMSKAWPIHPVITLDLGQNEAAEESDKRTPGRFMITAVPTMREIHLTVTCPGYKKKVIDTFSMTSSEKKIIDVQLEPLGGAKARIISTHPFAGGTIFWFSSAGAETERADIDPDGTFRFDRTHYRDETMTVVSASHPLWILVAPPVERATPLEVRFPDAVPQRNAEVMIEGLRAGMVTLVGVAIRNLRVPQPALVQHMALRGGVPVISGMGPLIIPALAESGPIDILRGPTAVLRPPRTIETFVVSGFTPTSSERLMAESSTVIFGASRR